MTPHHSPKLQTLPPLELDTSSESGAVAISSRTSPWDQILEARAERRELFDLQGDTYETWLDLAQDGVVRPLDNASQTPDLSRSTAKHLSDRPLHLRIDTPVLPELTGVESGAVDYSHTPIERPFPSLSWLLNTTPRDVLFASNASDETADASQPKSSLDITEASHSNRAAAIFALELWERQQELWLNRTASNVHLKKDLR